MTTIGDLLTRLERKIEEVIQVDQANEESVYAEITEYIATDSIREQYQQLLKAIADAPSDPVTNSRTHGTWHQEPAEANSGDLQAAPPGEVP